MGIDALDPPYVHIGLKSDTAGYEQCPEADNSIGASCQRGRHSARTKFTKIAIYGRSKPKLFWVTCLPHWTDRT